MADQTEVKNIMSGIIQVMDIERGRLALAAQAIQLLGKALEPGSNITGVGFASLLDNLQEAVKKSVAPAPAPAPAPDKTCPGYEESCGSCKDYDICSQ